MVRHEPLTLEPIARWLVIPVLSTIGAARNFEELPMDGWTHIVAPPGARPSDRYVAGVVHGESLADDGVRDGDRIIFRLTSDAGELKPGQLAAVFTPYGMLVKHVYLGLNGLVRLVSANPAFEDILLEASDVTLQGIAVELLRLL